MAIISMLEFLERRQREHEEREYAMERPSGLDQARHPAAAAGRADKGMGK